MLVRSEFNPGLHGTTRIKSGTNPIRECRSSGESSRMIERSIASQKFFPVAGPAHLASGKISERDTITEFCPPWIPGEHRSRHWIDLGRDKRSGGVARSCEHPF